MRITVTCLLASALFVAACTSSPPAGSAASTAARDDRAVARATLAPSGVLRIGVYPGSPTSMVPRAGGGGVCGMSVDLGGEVARRLGVAPKLVEFVRIEQVVDAVRGGDVDFTITNASPARAALVDFSAPVVAIELGYLVLPGSPVTSIEAVDRDGVRVGVTQGSTSQGTLGRTFRHAQILPAPSLKAAAEMLSDRRVDAFATNKAILHQMADGLPGARILDGRWGVESLAVAVPKGRERGLAWLDRFIASARQEGLVQRAAECAGLRGIAPPESR